MPKPDLDRVDYRIPTHTKTIPSFKSKRGQPTLSSRLPSASSQPGPQSHSRLMLSITNGSMCTLSSHHCHLILFDLVSSSPALASVSLSVSPRPPSRAQSPLTLFRRMHDLNLTLTHRKRETQPPKERKKEERDRDSHRSTKRLNPSFPLPLPLIRSCRPLSSDSRREVRSCPGRGSAFTSPSLSPSFGLNLISSDVRD
jgi:hypothetical protein